MMGDDTPESYFHGVKCKYVISNSEVLKFWQQINKVVDIFFCSVYIFFCHIRTFSRKKVLKNSLVTSLLLFQTYFPLNQQMHPRKY